MTKNLFRWVVVLAAFLGGVIGGETQEETGGQSTTENTRIPESCTLAMAPSSIPGGGWGVFTLVDRPRHDAVISGDVVIQVSDLNATHAAGIRRLAYDYGWNAGETGGQYEGITVMSVVPGIGMLANGSPRYFNVLPTLEPKVDEAGATRHSSPGAGAFTHYHNYTFHAQREIKAGEEIMVHYGPDWFHKRQDAAKEKDKAKLAHSMDYLMEHGFCLDNIKPSLSTVPEAGRGAFATRKLSKGSIVAPLPLLPITERGTFDLTRTKQVGPDETSSITTQQLLLNYCFGHPKSSVKFFPYSPLVNLINHSSKQSNVRLQWASVNKQHDLLSLEQLLKINTESTSSSGELLLELVATKDILEDDEILLDYGDDWEAAWNEHIENFEPYQRDYAPASIMDDEVPVLATQEEIKSTNPYPSNMITSCFYPYQHDDPAIIRNKNQNITKSTWKPIPGIFELRHLRPCTVMQRLQVETPKQDDGDETEPIYFYTVIIRNRYGLSPIERIPAGEMHVVTQVPRRAIRFTDKIYTTDQHLPGAFRKDIEIPTEIFPTRWMDLESSDNRSS